MAKLTYIRVSGKTLISSFTCGTRVVQQSRTKITTDDEALRHALYLEKNGEPGEGELFLDLWCKKDH